MVSGSEFELRPFSTTCCAATLPKGVPLAGYNHGERRVPHWPEPQETKYTTVRVVCLVVCVLPTVKWTWC